MATVIKSGTLPDPAWMISAMPVCLNRKGIFILHRLLILKSNFLPGRMKKVINMCANNYLGLSSHPDVIKAAHEGLDSRGYGMSSVRFICGTQDIHSELEKKVTKFLGTEDTILFPSCMDANAGVFEAVLTKR